MEKIQSVLIVLTFAIGAMVLIWLGYLAFHKEGGG